VEELRVFKESAEPGSKLAADFIDDLAKNGFTGVQQGMMLFTFGTAERVEAERDIPDARFPRPIAVEAYMVEHSGTDYVSLFTTVPPSLLLRDQTVFQQIERTLRFV
jgi:hypothetical protein